MNNNTRKGINGLKVDELAEYGYGWGNKNHQQYC
jgi:hypothetical protein